MPKTVLIGIGLASLLLVCYFLARNYRLRCHPLRLATVAIFVAATVFWAHQALSLTWATPKGGAAVDEAIRTTTTEEASPEMLNLPFAIEAESGTVWTVFGLEIVGKVMSTQTNGEYAVVVTTTPPSGGPPLHVHQREDELFYVMKGTYEFQFGDETVLATEGDMVHLPRHIPHRFRNIGSEPGTTMNMIIPGGFERFFADIDQLPKDQPLDRQQVADIASQYGLEFLPDS